MIPCKDPCDCTGWCHRDERDSPFYEDFQQKQRSKLQSRMMRDFERQFDTWFNNVKRKKRLDEPTANKVNSPQ